jgi:hypothetical protein
MRRPARGLAILLLVLCATGCYTRFRGDAHLDPEFDFSKVRSIGLAKPLPKEPADVARDRLLIVQEIGRQLEAKGYEIALANEADLLVIHHAGIGARTRIGGGDEARMTLQFIEARTGHSVWYGWTEQTWYPSMAENLQPEIEKGVRSLLERFPDRGRRRPRIAGSGDTPM